MPELTLYYRDIYKVIHYDEGSSLLETIALSGIPIEGSCGGRGKCGKCIFEILKGDIHTRDGKPACPLKGKANQYLACQVYGSSNLAVRVPDLEPGTGKVFKKEAGFHGKSEPVLKWHKVQIDRPTMKDPRSYQELLLASLKPGLKIGTIRLLKEIPCIIDESDGVVTVFSCRDEIIHIEPGKDDVEPLGLALDIGTTTIAGMLANLHTGRLIATETEANPQASFGADVISRIVAASTDEGLANLHRLVIDAVNTLVGRLCEKAKMSSERIYLATVAGNTTMNHLFAGVSPATLGTAPYVPIFKYFPAMRAEELGIHIHPAAVVEILPVIGGFVGADTVACILATGQHRSEEMTLLIDLGTNGEIVLGNRDGLIAASTAAGPAFEGVHISHGMRAVRGAIDRVTLNGDKIVVHTIDESAPKGICGSGLIDSVALLLSAGIIDGSGRLLSPEQLSSPPFDLSGMIREGDTGREFILVYSHESGTGNNITVSQADIREVQLAKGAIAAGITLLIEERGITPDNIARVYLAGAFGNSVNRDSAVAIGLIPGIHPDKIYNVGNAAGYGALMALLYRAELESAYTIAHMTGHKELATNERFNSEFVNALSFNR